MRVAILESIVTPAGHEVEFDRILVDGLRKRGHDPVFFVPEKFPFKIKYNAEVEYLGGGETVTYAGADRIKRLWLSLLREYRRRKWFNSAYKKILERKCDCLIIPTSSHRFIRTVLASDLKNSPVPVHIIVHGVIPTEKYKYLRQIERCREYENIRVKIMTLRNDFKDTDIANLKMIAPQVYKSQDVAVNNMLEYREPIVLGFFGQYRREKNIRNFLDAFKMAQFNVPVKLIVQGATVRREDTEEFQRIIGEYKDVPGMEFWHKSLLGAEWQQALLNADVILLPYAADRYRYQASAMLFTAIGFFKPVLLSPDINPEVMERFKIGKVLPPDNVEQLTGTLETFVNSYRENFGTYQENLLAANEFYSQEALIKSIMEDDE